MSTASLSITVLLRLITRPFRSSTVKCSLKTITFLILKSKKGILSSGLLFNPLKLPLTTNASRQTVNENILCQNQIEQLAQVRELLQGSTLLPSTKQTFYLFVNTQLTEKGNQTLFCLNEPKSNTLTSVFFLSKSELTKQSDLSVLVKKVTFFEKFRVFTNRSPSYQLLTGLIFTFTTFFQKSKACWRTFVKQFWLAENYQGATSSSKSMRQPSFNCYQFEYFLNTESLSSMLLSFSYFSLFFSS